MSNYYDAQVAVREAWKRVEGKYPMDDSGLDHWQRVADRHLQTVLDQAEEIANLTGVIERLSMRVEVGVPSGQSIIPDFEDAKRQGGWG